MSNENRGVRRSVIHALQNGTGQVLSKLAIISIPFLLSAIGALLNSTIEAREMVTREALHGLGRKVDDLSSRVDSLSTLVRENRDQAMMTEGDVRALRAQQSTLEKRFDERWRR